MNQKLDKMAIDYRNIKISTNQFVSFHVIANSNLKYCWKCIQFVLTRNIFIIQLSPKCFFFLFRFQMYRNLLSKLFKLSEKIHRWWEQRNANFSIEQNFTEPAHCSTQRKIWSASTREWWKVRKSSNKNILNEWWIKENSHLSCHPSTWQPYIPASRAFYSLHPVQW